MTGTYLEPQNTVDHAPPIIPIKKQTMTIDGCKVTINFNDCPNKTVIGEVKRLILDGLAKTS